MKLLMLLLSVLFSVHICECYYLNLMLPLSLRRFVGGSLVAKTLRLLEQIPERLWAREEKL